jgi:hypothetical protein
MLPFLKKKSEASAAPGVPAWHPNFRNYEKLPDIKVVRTAFFINGAAIFIALSLTIYFGFREWQLRVLNTQIAQTEAQITRDKKASDDAVKLFKQFQAEEARIKEVDAFVKGAPLFSKLMLRLASTLPPNIALDNVDLRETTLMLRFSVRGTGETAPAFATAYLEQLRNDKELSDFEDPAFTSTPSFNPATNRMSVEFSLRVKQAGGKK